MSLHDETNCHHAEESDDKWASLANAIRRPGDNDGKNRSRDVDWNSQQLCRA